MGGVVVVAKLICNWLETISRTSPRLKLLGASSASIGSVGFRTSHTDQTLCREKASELFFRP